MLTSQVLMGGHISGAHYNPAVTIAVLLAGREKITPLRTVLYVLVQASSSIVASFVCWAVAWDTIPFGVENDEILYTPHIAPAGHWWQAFIVETIFTFSLATIALTVGTSEQIKGNPYFGVAIGLVVAASGIAVGGKINTYRYFCFYCLIYIFTIILAEISGGAFNPAVGTGPLIVNALDTWNPWNLQWMWLYWTGNLVTYETMWTNICKR
jgi:aquaporin Z